jgi:sialic acid synthase SpsE/spore coat polysaccharide biosynthesis protein SpsF (cytidylyltransferase family)
MTVRAIIQARMLSKRLRGKSLMSVSGKPLLGRVLERIEAMSFVDEVVVATTNDAADEPIAALVRSRGIRCARGDRDNVLGRYVQAAAGLCDGDIVVRFTADNPLYDPLRSSEAYQAHVKGDWDYTHIDGLSHMVPEFIRVGALRHTGSLASDSYELEHVTPFLRKHPELFKVQMLPPDFAGLRGELDQHLTIDSQEQLELFERMLAEVERANQFVRLDECYLWLDRQRAGLKGIAAGPAKHAATIKIAGHEIGDGCPVFIVAEIGQNHNGQLGMAKRLIEMAARCGCDAVKFQKRDIHWELTQEMHDRPYENDNSFGKTYGAHREYLELSEEQHRELREYAMASKLIYFCTACDPPSVQIMERLGNPAYKIASRDIANGPLLRAIAQTRKPMILSTGMAGLAEIREAICELGEHPPPYMLTQCISQYPADIENLNLRAIQTLAAEFGCPVGLSDHAPGIITAVAGAVIGACLIEKHITLSRAMPGTDHAGALEEDDLRNLVRHIRTCAIAMGDGKKEYNPVVDAAKAKLGRSLTNKMPIRAGTLLTDEMIVMKSPGTGLAWRDRGRVVGKRAKHDIPADRTLTPDDFE